jgi:hypothetical protein
MAEVSRVAISTFVPLPVYLAALHFHVSFERTEFRIINLNVIPVLCFVVASSAKALANQTPPLFAQPLGHQILQGCARNEPSSPRSGYGLHLHEPVNVTITESNLRLGLGARHSGCGRRTRNSRIQVVSGYRRGWMKRCGRPLCSLSRGT